jgi:putative hydrolase of the HAD superfamily
MTDVDAALFDLDGTLVEYERGIAELLALSFDAVGVEPCFAAAEYERRFAAVVKRDEVPEGIRATCFAELAAENGRDPDVGRAVAEAYAAERDHSRVELLAGAKTVLDALARDHRLGLVTNGPPDIQRPKLAATGLDDWFDSVVYAGHDTAAKPDPEPFHHALDALGSTPERAVYVGNSLRADVAGAHAAGCRSVWVPADGDDPDPEPHYAAASLSELDPAPWL